MEGRDLGPGFHLTLALERHHGVPSSGSIWRIVLHAAGAGGRELDHEQGWGNLERRPPSPKYHQKWGPDV